MAEAIARERHGADGREFVSAGTVGLADRPMTVEAVDALAKIGIAPDPHAAAPLDAELVAAADHIYVMEAHHGQWIASRWPESWTRVQLLDPSGRAVQDPFGRFYPIQESMRRFSTEMYEVAAAPTGS